ncbi:zf-TFIIB domain-containing protein [Rhodobacter sp. KR11]|uniref:TFIIB-type zinc ribbon-containing protein n=1 Tax=Rhodobacter sp. KR11 TaxID=2974588 RepID=UPI002222BA71|nr:zf-TFIIB domain-containing protein [Rhodobacter sp. KR11]MCW1920021.1 zf-TFIIB domain-containing protein [Rhodobacter sp. KR11]
MKCPVDGETLVMADRSGVEIDYCPKCRGVWLDRGELDKIIERAAAPAVAAPPPPPQAAQPVYREERRDDRYDKDRSDKDRYDDRYHGKRKRESFLGELFDF